MLSRTHACPNTKQHLDCFGHFCTAHGRETLYFTTDRPFPHLKLPLLMGDLDPIQYMVHWARPRPQPKRHLDRFSRFAQLTTYTSSWTALPPSNCHFPLGSGPHPLHDCFGPPESSTQTAPGSVQSFLHSCPHSVPILYNGPPLSIKMAPSHWYIDPT